MPTTTILVPLQPPHHCQLCLPIPREYIDHAGLVRHLKREHDTVLHFECRACGLVMEKLKSLKAHQRRAEACRSSIDACSPPQPPPTDRRIRRIRVRRRNSHHRTLGSQNTTPPTAPTNQSSCSSAMSSPTLDPPSPPARRVTRSIQHTIDNRTNMGSQYTSPAAMTNAGPRSTGNSPSGDHLPRAQPPQGSGYYSPTSRPSNPGLGYTNDTAPLYSEIAARGVSPPISPMASQPPAVNRRPRRRQPSDVRDDGHHRSPPQGRSGTSGSYNSRTVDSPAHHISNSDQPPIQPMSTNQHSTSLPSTADPSAIPSWVLNWKHRFEVATDGDMLEAMVEDLVSLAQNICSVSETTIQPRDHTPSYSSIPSDARRIQRLYRLNRKKAIDCITKGQPNYCHIDGQELYTHFKRSYAHNSHHHSSAPSATPPCTDLDSNNPLASPFTPEEVATRIRRCHNTAPGPDGLRYHHWARVDPKGIILSSVFNAVLRTSFIPPSWQRSNTILLHKKGDVRSVSNWRPIALSNTLGKIFSACLANRLLLWCQSNNILSSAQKGFLQHEGCLDHNFLLQTIIQDARRKHRSCHIAWLDISNAFGSVPHDTISQCLQWCKLHEESTDIITSLLQNCSTRIRTSNGYTDDIPIHSGVKQGCPLSPLLFNIVIETAVRNIQHLQLGYPLEGEPIDILAYADDLVLISPTAEGLQKQLDCITNWAAWAGLRFNAGKCASLSVKGKQHGIGNEIFNLQGTNIPPLSASGSYDYLGIPTGFSTHHTPEDVISNLEKDIRQLDESKLAPWQKIHAINTMLLPKLTFHLLLGSNPKKRLRTLDRHIKNCAKRWLNLPQRASAEVIHLPYDHGGANITPCGTLADICQITHGTHLFTSRDHKVRSIAIKSLQSVVRKRIRRDPSLEDLCTYLNGSMEGEFGVDPADISSSWSRLRSATRRLRKHLDITWTVFDDTIAITTTGNIIPRQSVTKILTNMAKNVLLNRLLRKPDQGKAFQLTAQHPASNHFIRSGLYTSFADWRFIHRARLSVVPLHGLRRFGQLPANCRHCGFQQETLAHVINHCARNLHLATERHNAVLNRLRRAVNDEDLTIKCNQRIPGFEGNCRPDLMAINDNAKTATIIDVVIPFENGHNAFNSARDKKIEKYTPLAQHFRNMGYDTYCDAFVVGSLGAYDPGNIAVLQRLGIGRKYSKTMAKLMVSDCIRWSREIYVQHLNYGRSAPSHRRPATNARGQHHRRRTTTNRHTSDHHDQHRTRPHDQRDSPRHLRLQQLQPHGLNP
ncbi:uncharacterized protein LOC111617214 [Centruroides sculpturatus]|uniref:uncharacterized protein LOC111617214 n=1 Tax=Centruroides sculpturatus TaxID=218467 RepID=UPI000C6C986F|nr:uncharacterized protein LOC111617214 [Centruroides sculpturatus]